MLEYFGIHTSRYVQPPRYNIAPGQELAAIVSDGQARRVGPLKWGLVPAFAKDPKMGFTTINARAETLLQRPAFKRLLQRKRCLIPADGFYEWKKIGSAKQPMRIVLTDRKVFAFAGLYDTWTGPDGNKLNTCTIITTGPNELMGAIHDRMPAILHPDDEEGWLSRDGRDMAALLATLKPYPSEQMRAYPVSLRVGNVKNEGIELIQPLQA